MSSTPLKVAPISAADHVPLREKLAYGAGGLGGAIQGQVDNRLMNPVFVATLQLSPSIMGLRLLTERIFDAVTDALMGWVTDNTRTRWGRRKPYILIGGILASMFLPVLFMFGREWSDTGLIVWMFSVSLALTLCTTIWNIPYQCMLMEITPNSRERTNVVAWRGYVGKLGNLTMAWVWFLTQLPIFAKADGSPDTITGARWVVTGFAVLALGCALAPLWVKSRVPLAAGAAKVPLRESLFTTFKNRTFRVLIFFTLLFTLGFGLKTGLDFYVMLYHVGQGQQKITSEIAGWAGTINFVVGLAGIGFFQWMAGRYGKKASLKALMWVVFGASLSTYVCYTPAMPYLALFPSLLLAPATAGLWVLIPSMTGDVADDDQVSTGQRREGSFVSTYSWFMKASGALALGLTGPIVEFVAGFTPKLWTLGEQDPEVMWRLRLLLAVLPALCIGAAIWVLRRYPLDEDKIEQNHAIPEARRREAADQSAPSLS
jgi:glycoside/pentoside/hexuronide:cation symporter, GPH family